MRTHLRFSALLFFLGAALCVAADNPSAPYKDKGGNWIVPTFFFQNGKGNWETARLWRDGKAPSGVLPRANILGGNSVTISKPIPYPMSSIYLGVYYDKKTEVFFEKDAKLSVGGMVMPVPYVEGSNVDFYMRGGELSVGDLKESEFNVIFNIGTGGTTSGRAHFTISDGTLSSGLRVGSSAANTNTGKFTIEGSKPTVKAANQKTGNIIHVWASGTLEFILDEEGVSTINHPKSEMLFNTGANIVVDGKAYRGKSKTIVLVEADKVIVRDHLNKKVTGFSPNYQAEIVIEKKRVVLKIGK